jgi:hypothetical protein
VTGTVLTQAEAVGFAHALVQVIAEDHGVDLLHIKGPALDGSLRRSSAVNGDTALRQSVDADVLVRPSHVNRLSQALAEHGWRRHFDFEDGSAFGHAATWGHDNVGYLDVHRYFPGIELDPSAAFDLLWGHRDRQDIAGIPCEVPEITAQRLVMIIHAARGRRYRDILDIETAWGTITEADRAAIEALADELHARVALYAGTGRLDQVADEHTYPLWRELTSPRQSLLTMWWARVRAEPDLVSSVRKGVHLVLPNRRRMETWLGRPPTWREVATAYGSRVRLGGRAARTALASRRRS